MIATVINILLHGFMLAGAYAAGHCASRRLKHTKDPEPPKQEPPRDPNVLRIGDTVKVRLRDGLFAQGRLLRITNVAGTTLLGILFEEGASSSSTLVSADDVFPVDAEVPVQEGPVTYRDYSKS